MSDRPPIPWRNACLRKFGASIHALIEEAWRVDRRARIAVMVERAKEAELDRQLEQAPAKGRA